MKKTICALLTLCLMLSVGIPAYAKTDMSTVFDSADELKQVENKILDSVNFMLSTYYNDTLTGEDIDYNNCLRLYYGTDILTNNNINENNIIEAIDNADYEYEIFLTYNNLFPKLAFSKTKPISEENKELYTEEELKELENQIGEWNLASMVILKEKDMYQRYKEDIERFLKSSNETYSKVHVICDFPGDIGAVAMLITEDSEIQFKVLDGIIDNKKIDYNNPEDTLYTLAKLKEITAQYVPPEPGLIGETEALAPQPANNTIIIAAAAAGAVILVCAAAAVIILRARKKKAEFQN